MHSDFPRISTAWADKTMSVLQARQHEERVKRVSSFPAFGLFDEIDSAQAELLYLISYEGQSRRYAPVLHTVEALRTLVLERLPREALLLSPQEYQLLVTLNAEGGEAPLHDAYLLMGAESLARRLWCTIRQKDDELVASIPGRLSVRIADIWSTEDAEEVRNQLSVFHTGMVSTLSMYGAVLADSALSVLMMTASRPWLINDPQLCLRMLKATYPHVYNQKGQLVLTHPGLADPALMADAAGEIDLNRIIVNPEHSQMLLSDAERDAAMGMSTLLEDALRPEYYPPSSTEDLRILIKQGVPIQELEDVLATQLAVQPTPAMKNALRLMQSHTPTWLIHTPGRLH